jgi:hypothetical protein
MRKQLIIFLICYSKLAVAVAPAEIHDYKVEKLPYPPYLQHSDNNLCIKFPTKKIYCDSHYNVFCGGMCRLDPNLSILFSLGNPYTLGLSPRRLMSPNSINLFSSIPVSLTPHIESLGSAKSDLMYENEIIFKPKENVEIKMKKDQVGIDIKY